MAPRNKPSRCCAPPSHTGMDAADRDMMVALAKALADPTRIEVLRLLAAQNDPVCACDIAALFALSQPTMSHHLKKLEDVGLVEGQRSGLWRYYAMHPSARARMESFGGLVAGPQSAA